MSTEVLVNSTTEPQVQDTDKLLRVNYLESILLIPLSLFMSIYFIFSPHTYTQSLTLCIVKFS